MSYTDDPIADFDARDRKEAEWLASLPRCANCDEPIQDDHFYMINDEPICPDCLESDYRKRTEDYIA